MAWVLLLGCGGEVAGTDAGPNADTGTPPVDAGAPVEPELGVYSEFLSDDAVIATLPALAARGAALQLAITNDRIGEASLAGVIAAASEAGVEVRLWLLLPIAMGYWPNEDNLALFATEVLRLLDWVDAEGLTVAAVVYDMEPAFDYSEELRVAFADSSLDVITTLMSAHVDRAAYESARDALAAHVLEVQARGVRAEAVTYPQVVDDMGDGDADLQDALDIPVDGVPFDDVAFMVYQTAFTEGRGVWLGPGLVRSYATDAHAYFGDRATIALGIIGSATIVELDGPPYADPDALREDVAAALGGGVSRIEFYSLDGMVELDDVPGWLGAASAVPSSPPISPDTRVVRGAASGLDGALDR